MPEPKRLHLTVNGRPHEAVVESRTTLVDFLRGELGLGGTHVGCEHGVCGACTVLWNGRAVRSCIMLAVQADGADLMTVEGLTSGPPSGRAAGAASGTPGSGGTLHPIQQAFLEEHGLQCGFCTPGFLISIYELLGRSPDPSDAEIMDTLGGHICRCTGYQTIVKAVRTAAAKMRAAGSPRAPGDTRAADTAAPGPRADRAPR